jgi:hypothetical protein
MMASAQYWQEQGFESGVPMSPDIIETCIVQLRGLYPLINLNEARLATAGGLWGHLSSMYAREALRTGKGLPATYFVLSGLFQAMFKGHSDYQMDNFVGQNPNGDRN